jgi:hypothetical protein
MDPNAKKTKKKARKFVFGEGRSTGQGGKQVPLLPADIQSAWQDEEDLVDYEPEEPAAFSPIQDDVSVQGDHTSTLEEGPHDFPPNTDDFPAFSAEDGHMAGRKRSQIFLALPTRQVLLNSKPPLIQT